MSSIVEKTVISKPIDSLWEQILDPASFVESFSDAYGFSYDVLPAKFSDGGVLRFEMSRWYVGQEWLLEIAIHEERHQIVLNQKLGPFKKWKLSLSLEEHGEDQCLVTEALNYKMKFSVLGGIVDDLFLRRDLKLQLKTHQNFLRSKS